MPRQSADQIDKMRARGEISWEQDGQLLKGKFDIGDLEKVTQLFGGPRDDQGRLLSLRHTSRSARRRLAEVLPWPERERFKAAREVFARALRNQNEDGPSGVTPE